MRNKFVALILGLTVILITPAFTAKYADDAKKESTKQVEFSQPEVMNDSLFMEVEEMEVQVCCAGFFPFLQIDSPEPSPGEDTGEGEIVPDNEGESDSLLGWRDIIIAILGAISLLFGRLWDRGRRTISAIDLALKDGNVDKDELTDIVNAWKGN